MEKKSMLVPHRSVLIVLAAVATVVVAFLLQRPKNVDSAQKEQAAYPLCIARLPEGEWNAPPVVSPEIVDALARALTAEENVALRGALEASADLWEVRANPMVDALDDASPDAPLEAWMKTAPREVAIARAALVTRYCARDGFCVEPADAHGRCADGFAPARSAGDVRRASFLALPYGAARTVKVGSRDALSRIQTRLHTASHRALVVRPAGSPACPDAAPLRAALERYEATKAIALSPSSARSARGPVEPPRPRTLQVADGTVLLLPAGTVHTDAPGWQREVDQLAL